MNKQFRFAIMAGAAVALFAQVPAPLWGQEADEIGAKVAKRLHLIDGLEDALKQAEELRLSGNCKGFEGIAFLFLRRLRDRPLTYHISDGPPAELSEKEAADFELRMRELLSRECPPGSGTTLMGTPVAQPGTPPTPVAKPPASTPVPPAPVGSVGTTGGTQPPAGTGEAPPKGLPPAGGAGPKPTGAEPTESEPFESILDEIDEVPQPEPRRTAPPVPPRPPEDIHVVPRPFPIPPPVPPRKPDRTPVPPPPVAPAPVGSVGSRGDYLEDMAPLRAALDAAIANCDRAAFKAAKNRLLDAIGQLLTRFPENIHFLAERRRIEETQLPQPCPPVPATTPDQSMNLNPFARDILTAHNAARAAVGAPPLKWVPALEASATAHAGKMAQAGQLVHAPREGRGIERENLLQAPIGYSTGQMMQRWTGESRHFVPGIFPNVCTGDWSKCAHYSQMIWPTTTDLGCGSAQGGGFNWVVCRYSPGGNKDGKPVGRGPEHELPSLSEIVNLDNFPIPDGDDWELSDLLSGPSLGHRIEEQVLGWNLLREVLDQQADSAALDGYFDEYLRDAPAGAGEGFLDLFELMLRTLDGEAGVDQPDMPKDPM